MIFAAKTSWLTGIQAFAWENGNAASPANEAARTTAAKRSRPGLTPTSRTTGTEG